MGFELIPPIFGKLAWRAVNGILWDCVYCKKSVIGDSRYHEVYENGLLVGYRHRKCPQICGNDGFICGNCIYCSGQG